MKKIFLILFLLPLSIIILTLPLKVQNKIVLDAVMFTMMLLIVVYIPYDIRIEKEDGNKILILKYLLRTKRYEVKSMFSVDVRSILRLRKLGITIGKINFGLYVSIYGDVLVYCRSNDGVFIEADNKKIVVDAKLIGGCD